MKRSSSSPLLLVSLAAVILPGIATAQLFTYNQYGDALVGFRKTGVNAGNYEMVVNLGSITNLLAMSPGTTTTISKYTVSQLSNAFPTGFGNLQWSVFSAFPGAINPWVTPLGSFPKNTLWYTLPAAGIGTQTTPPPRDSSTSQQPNKNLMLGVGNGAASISQNVGASDPDNTATSIREPVSFVNYILSTFISDAIDPTKGNFGASQTPLPYVVENVTPDNFGAAQRCDFYQMCPTGLVDPITGLATGTGYFVGYFILHPDGTLSFTRAGGTTPPPAPTLTIGRQTTQITISFATANNANYTLYHTDLTGLTSSISTWTQGGSLVGDGSTKSFVDTITGANRVYAVKAQ